MARITAQEKETKIAKITDLLKRRIGQHDIVKQVHCSARLVSEIFQKMQNGQESSIQMNKQTHTQVSKARENEAPKKNGENASDVTPNAARRNTVSRTLGYHYNAEKGLIQSTKDAIREIVYATAGHVIKPTESIRQLTQIMEAIKNE